MDWTVILDGFVLLMQVAATLFLLWGFWLLVGSRSPRDEPAGSTACPDDAAREAFQ